MYKPPIFNRYLNKKWNDIENDLMIQKLTQAKPTINQACPESYVFFKTKLKKPKLSAIETFREKEIKRNNEILGDKIINIFAVSNKKKSKPKHELKQTSHSNSRKMFIQKVEQDNQFMLKRLIDKPSCYDKNEWIRDFEKSQNYKRNICVFPSIKFYRDTEHDKLKGSLSPKNLEPKNPYDPKQLQSRSNTSHQKFKNMFNPCEKLYGSKYFQNTEDSNSRSKFNNNQFGATASNFFKTQNQSSPNPKGNAFAQVDRSMYLVPEKNLIYSKKIELENFGESYINFYLDNHGFYACITPTERKAEVREFKGINVFGKKYILLFERYDESDSSIFETIIKQIVYFPKYDLIYLSQEEDEHITYKTYWIKGNQLGEIIKSSNLEFSNNNQIEDQNNNLNNNNNNNNEYNLNDNAGSKLRYDNNSKSNMMQNHTTIAEKVIENGLQRNQNSQLNFTETISNNLYLTNTNIKNSNHDKADKVKFNFDEDYKNTNEDRNSNITPNKARKNSRNSGNDFDSTSKKNQKNSMEISESNNKNFSNKGHKYQKSQTLTNLDNSQNKKNYLEENIYEIIQNIEKIENN